MSLITLFDTITFHKRYNTILRNPDEKGAASYETFPNTPTRGFMIDRERGAYTSKDSDVLIIDPRGFAVKVDWSGFSESILNMTIHNGLIMNECVWGKVGSVVNMLIPVGSDLYDSVTGNTNQRKAPSLKKSTVKPGDLCLARDNTTHVYLGEVSCIQHRVDHVVAKKSAFLSYTDGGFGKVPKFKSFSTFTKVVRNIHITPQTYMSKDGDHGYLTWGLGGVEYHHELVIEPNRALSMTPVHRHTVTFDGMGLYRDYYGNMYEMVDDCLTRIIPENFQPYYPAAEYSVYLVANFSGNVVRRQLFR